MSNAVLTPKKKLQLESVEKDILENNPAIMRIEITEVIKGNNKYKTLLVETNKGEFFSFNSTIINNLVKLLK